MNIPKTYLIEVSRPEAGHILDLLTKTKEAKKATELQSYYKKLAQWGTQNLQKTGEIILDKIALSYKDEVIKLGLAKRTKNLWGMINALTELMEKHSLNEENAKIIQQTTLEILAGLSKTPMPEQEEESEEEPDLYEGMDWTAEKTRRLIDARETKEAISAVLDKFYDDYYSVEYAGKTKTKPANDAIVAKLKSLDKILVMEFNKLGYSPEVNPFAQFLKILISEKQDIFNKLNTNNYGAIHNAFIEKNITGNMLGNYNEANILFCSDLYNKNGRDVVEYLSLHKDVVDKVEKSNKYSTNAIAKMFIVHEQLDKNFAKNVELLFDENNKNVIYFAKDGAKLRSLSEIQELYRLLFGATIKKRVDVEEIVKEAINKKAVLDMVQCLIDQVELKKAHKGLVQELRAWLKDLNYQRNDDKIDDAEEILSAYRLDADSMRSIAVALQNYYNKNARDKKADDKS